MNRLFTRAVRVLLLSASILPAAAPADEGDPWVFGASINGWFPDIAGRTAFPSGPGGGDFTIDVKDIIENLEFTLQGSFDARKGSWGFFTDVIYMDVGTSNQNLREGTIGGSQIPASVTASVRLDMKSLISAGAGYYRMSGARPARRRSPTAWSTGTAPPSMSWRACGMPMWNKL